MRKAEQPACEECPARRVPLDQQFHEERHASERQRPEMQRRIAECGHQPEHEGAAERVAGEQAGKTVHRRACYEQARRWQAKASAAGGGCRGGRHPRLRHHPRRRRSGRHACPLTLPGAPCCRRSRGSSGRRTAGSIRPARGRHCAGRPGQASCTCRAAGAHCPWHGCRSGWRNLPRPDSGCRDRDDGYCDCCSRIFVLITGAARIL